MVPLFAELCAGTAALSLRLQGGRSARPPVSRMGNKQGYGGAILRTLGLRSGSGAARYLWCEPDPGCRLLLLSYTDADLRGKAAQIIRGWRDEDPRALWERLRAEGPVRALEPREVARWCYLAQSSVRRGDPDSGYDDEYARFQKGTRDKPRHPAVVVADRWIANTLPATVTDDARQVDPREVARWCLSAAWTQKGLLRSGYWAGPDRGGPCGEHPEGWTGSITIPGLTSRLSTLPTLPATVTDDARPLQPARLPPGSIAYIDPPYMGTTGYGHDLTREEVCTLAERWASAGALVVISEAEPLTELSGWHQVEITGERKGQKRTFSRQQREYLTMSGPPCWRPSLQRALFPGAA